MTRILSRAILGSRSESITQQNSGLRRARRGPERCSAMSDAFACRTTPLHDGLWGHCSFVGGLRWSSQPVTWRGLALRWNRGRLALASCLIMLGGCGDGIDVRNSPADSLATARYVELLRAELSAADLIAATNASQCELSRLLRVFTGLHGHAYAIGVSRGAEERAFRGLPDSVMRHHEGRLPEFTPAVSDKDCAALARAGILGDTLYPPIPEWKP